MPASLLADEEAKLQDDGDQLGAHFGNAVAADGERVLVGLIDGSSALGQQTGTAQVFVRVGGTWLFEQELSAFDGVTGDRFGAAVGLNGDVIVVGAPDDVHAGSYTGSAYTYRRIGGVWVSEAKLLAVDGGVGDGFGNAVDVEGALAMVGASHHNSVGFQSGAVYVFQYAPDSGWVASAKLQAPGGQAGDLLGGSLALSAGTLAVSAVGGNGLVPDSGLVHLWEESAGLWEYSAALAAADGDPLDFFAKDLDLAGDTLVVGAYLEEGGGFYCGSAYIFERNAGVWSQTQKLIGGQSQAGDGFGYSVALGEELLAIGMPYHDALGFASGAVTVFRNIGTTWFEQELITASDGVADDLFGNCLAFAGEYIFIGAPEDDSTGHEPGSVYVFDAPLDSYPYCFGDGQTTDCPCGNSSGIGQGEGCHNSTGLGAILDSYGSHSVAVDDLHLRVNQVASGQPCLLFQGTQALVGGAGIPFGDGLRCLVGGVWRLQIRFANGTGQAIFGPGLAGVGSWTPGAAVLFQVWYRDPVGGPCASGYNLSNGLWLQMIP